MAHRFISNAKNFEVINKTVLKSCIFQLLRHRHTPAWLSNAIKLESICKHHVSFNVHTRLFTDKPSKPDSQSQQPNDKKSAKIPPPTQEETGFKFRLKIGDYEYNSGGGGGKGGKKSNWPDEKQMFIMGTIGSVLLVYTLYSTQYREITMKEFFQNYLSSGMVEQVEVINNKWVRVKFMPGSHIDASNTIWFTIGSVETFERNLEKAQIEMNLDPSNFITVVYKKERDWGSILLNAMGWILPLAVMIWLFRRGPLGKPGGGRGGSSGGMFGFSQTTAKVLEKDIGVKFRSVSLFLSVFSF
uniref:Peptidase M41 FtsH extracellular domain-containing protein n=1 Tax=Biomphalaria glabrata TaxID=6526 RepID=A0A2C9KMH8_BIOGL